MPLNSDDNYSLDLPLRPLPSGATTSTSSASADASDGAAFTTAPRNQPAVARPDKIARARQLLADADYPSDPVLNQLAGFLAGKL